MSVDRAHQRALDDVNGDLPPHGWRDLAALVLFTIGVILAVVILAGYVDVSVTIR